MEEASRTQRMLYVGGLEAQVTEQVLKAAFIPFGEIVDVQIPMDHVAQKNRGFGFVAFAEEADAKDAMENMDNSELFGRTIRVNVAKPQTNKKKALWESADEWFQALKEAEDLDGDDAGKGADASDLKPAER